jgi:predicted nuclease with TOPRIM domain
MCQTDHQHRLQGVTKKAVKKGLVAANWDLIALDNGIIVQNYQGLCQKHKALQEESVLVAEELESADAEVKKLQEKNEAVVAEVKKLQEKNEAVVAEVKKLQEEKYGLLDQLLVFEGLSVDPYLPFKI